MQWIVAWALVAITASFLGAVLAGYKNRDYSSWIAWCFLFPPAIIWLLMMPKYIGPRPRQPRMDDLDRRDNGPF